LGSKSTSKPARGARIAHKHHGIPGTEKLLRLGTLSDHLVGAVSETMQPTHASLWLRTEIAPRGEQADRP
jgi:hypothetical protein